MDTHGTRQASLQPLTTSPKASGTKTLYNGRLTIAKKCAYINANGYGGIMIWQLLQDAGSDNNSLLKIIDKNLN